MEMLLSGYSFSVCRPPMAQLRNCQGAATRLPSLSVISVHTRGQQPLLDRGDLHRPALLRGGRGSAGRLLGGDLLAGAELAELARVGQQPVQQTDAAGGQEEAADVDEDIRRRRAVRRR